MPADSGFARTWETDKDNQNSLSRKNIKNAAKRMRAYAG
jgi:hypothetical protein